ncbi:MAG TPA: hypothetical protein VIG99_02800 [Myxococcaceae bacterium]|jgi:hypothetical protein
MKKLILTCAVLALTPGCIGMQRVTINTSTPGAQIVVVKRGELRTHNTVVGVLKQRSVEQYQENPEIVGTSPMVYDFMRVDEGSSWGIGGVFQQKQKKVCQWLEIRASTPNGEYAQQLIPVNGEDTNVFLQMSPQPMPPAHAATSVPQPRS